MRPCFSLLVSISVVVAQTSKYSAQLQPSVTLQDDNLDDSITQIFNSCKCTIFYQCDEENFIIPNNELSYTRVKQNGSLRNVQRIRCSNEFYYCCKQRKADQVSKVRRCGQITPSPSRIIDEFPWVVAIYVKMDGVYGFKCGGSLIHRRIILTTRECVHLYQPWEIKMVANREDLSETVPQQSVSKKIEFETTYSDTMYDIALLVLSIPLDDITPLCLPKPYSTFNGKRCTAVGWGASVTRQRRVPKLRRVSLPIVESQECQTLLRNTSLGPNYNLHYSFLCAGGEEGIDTCRNDGGGPLICEEEGRYVQVGITSWGLRCGQQNVPGVYTNVPVLMSWIEQKVLAEAKGG